MKNLKVVKKEIIEKPEMSRSEFDKKIKGLSEMFPDNETDGFIYLSVHLQKKGFDTTVVIKSSGYKNACAFFGAINDDYRIKGSMFEAVLNYLDKNPPERIEFLAHLKNM